MSLPVPAGALHEAIISVMQAVEGFVKSAPQQGGVRFATQSANAVIATIRPALVQQGITVHIASMRLTQDTVPIGNQGQIHNRAVIEAVVRFTHAKTGHTLDVATTGEGTDSAGFSVAKAQTSALKNALIDTFLLVGFDDASGQQQRRQSPTPENRPQAAPVEPGTVAAKIAGLDTRNAFNAFWGAARDARWPKDAIWKIASAMEGEEVANLDGFDSARLAELYTRLAHLERA